MKKINKLIIIIFFSIIIGFFTINIFKADNIFSKSERRKLAQFPEVKINSINNFSNQFEKYATDQFFYRDEFRTIKNYIEFFMFRKEDVHSLILYNNSISKYADLNEKSVINAVNKINNVYDKYLKGMNTYYTIVPNKISYIPEKEGYPNFNYEEMEKIVDQNINQEIIDIRIFDELDYDSYYRTDSHWKQEKIIGVANKISKILTNEELKDKYETKKIEEFYGVYYGQLQYKIEPDTILYLTNEKIESANVYNYETNTLQNVYNLKKIDSIDKYDIFLSGATSLLDIENFQSDSERELIVFRDSFASSLIPLLIEKYKKITVVDLRYISSNLLEQYIKFEKQDILFIYSSMLLNDSFSLK